MDKFKRVIEIKVGSKQYTNEDIDIDFMYEFDDKIENNVSEISLWNVNEDTINQIKKGTQVVLNAGYGEDIGVVLIGKVGNFEVITHDIDRELKLYVSDGLNLWGSQVKKTYENLKADKIVEDILNIIGVKVGKVQVENNITYQKLVVDNTIESILKKIAKETNSKFYIKSGRGYFVNKDYADRNIILLNKDSGLLDIPSKIMIDEKIGWKINSLLEHRISVGSYVQIQSKVVNGSFRVVKGRHDSDFTTEIEVLSK